MLNFIRVAAAVPRLEVADPAFNTNEIIKLYRQAAEKQSAAVVFPELSMRIYTDNHELIYSSENAVYVMCIASFLQIMGFILFNAVSGTGAIKTIVVIELLNLMIYLLFLWLVIIRHRPSPAVAWSSEIIYQGFILLSCLLYLLFGNWRNKKI